jgi:hypothetical protein
LDYVRNRQRNRQWRTHHTLPATIAGWVLPADTQPAGADGHRPLGAVREDLLQVVQHAGLQPADQLIIEAWYGLREFPADLTGPGALAARVAARQPRRLRTPLTSRAVSLRRELALKTVAAHLPRRPAGAAQNYSALPPAWREPWCLPLSDVDLRRAFDRARDLLAVGSAEPADSLTNRLHAELDELRERIANRRGTVTHRLACANAALSIALWEFAAPTVPQSHRTERRSPVPSLTRSAVENAVRAAAPAEAAPLLRGNHDDHSLLAAARSAAQRATDPRTAWPILEICLTEAQTGMARRDPAVVVKVLYTVVRYAQIQEDWRAVTLARQLVDEHPTHMATLNACVAASVTAGAHLRFHEALRALDRAERILPGIAWLPPHQETIETAEWTFLLRLARTAVLRRVAENAVAAGASDPYSSDALQLALQCSRDAWHLPGFDGQHSDGGDADAGYLALPLLRAAELHGLDAQKRTLAGRPATRALHRARGAMTYALDWAAGQRNLINADFSVLDAKLRLRLAVVQGSEEEAVEASTALLAEGWPLERSDLPMFLALKEAQSGRPEIGLTDSMRRAARAALDAAPPSDGSNVPQFRVPVGHRRSQLRVFGSTS